MRPDASLPRNLPQIYAAVVKLRPDLKMPHMFWVRGEGWYAGPQLIHPTLAKSYLLDTWVNGLPNMAWLGRVSVPCIGWRVCYRRVATTHAESVMFSPIMSTPIKALAAFYLGETT